MTITDHQKTSVDTAPGIPALTITRDTEAYTQWWARSADQDDIRETLESIAGADSSDVAHGLHSLMTDIECGGVQWLRVDGLTRGVGIRYLSVDIEPARDGEGILDGVEVVASVMTDTGAASLMVSSYTSKPWATFAPEPGADPETALAQIIDTALAMINAEIADRDHFLITARGVHVTAVA